MAVHTAQAQRCRPGSLSELVEDALRAYLPTVAKSVNGGRPFDAERGAYLRAARRRSPSQ